jgi:hypothetical protein
LVRGVRWVRTASDLRAAALAVPSTTNDDPGHDMTARRFYSGFKHRRRIGHVMAWTGGTALLFVVMTLPPIFAAAAKADGSRTSWSWTATLAPLWATSVALTMLGCCGCCSSLIETHSDYDEVFGVAIASAQPGRWGSIALQLRRTFSAFWLVPILIITLAWALAVLLVSLRLDVEISLPWIVCLLPLLILELVVLVVIVSVGSQKIHSTRTDGR